ncbi:hypothetical protein GJ688_05990 [Heliobacillus mobilis]|uniref:Uncharacterized protein n=1 Tax=Heliobacterium mobile TaxID=28064 RepID=A0A6I3SIE8_HELMO|nr:hypothetical protein [Heliobacterium mobile]
MVVSIYGFFSLFIQGKLVHPDSVVIEQVKGESDNSLYIKGDIMSSSLGFSGYNCMVEKNSLYLQLRYSLVSSIHPTGNFEIKIPEGLDDVTKMYLVGTDRRDIKLIWSR